MPTTVPHLLERAAELAAIEAAVTDAEAGTGRSLLVSGPAGVGKSSLVLHAREMARDRGFTVLHSCPTPVSGALAHGVVRDWVGPLARQRGTGGPPFDGPAEGLAGALSDSGQEQQRWTLNALDYALRWVLDHLGQTAPLLLVVDDVQWADSGSLQLLDLLSARLHSSPGLLLLARRTGEAALREDILDRLTARALVLTPQPLSVAGVDRLRRLRPGSPETEQIPSPEMHRLTGGLPFLVHELLRSGRWAPGQAPRTVVESVRERLGRLGQPTLEIARTVAVLGEEATFDAVGELCGLSVAELADPLEVLTHADIVTLGLWQAWPSHPLISEAIRASMSPSERSEQHRRAAAYLAGLDRPRQVVASHLVHTLPREDRAVVDLLVAAAEESLGSGSPQVAAAQLLRAVGETTPGSTDPELVRKAARAHMRAGMAEQALALWRRALARTGTAEDRALCLADIGDAQMTIGDGEAHASYEAATRLLVDSGHDSSSPTLRLLLSRTWMARPAYDEARDLLERAVAEAVAQPREHDTHADRLLLALQAARLALQGHDHRQVRALALRAVAGGRLLAEETADGHGIYLATGVLCVTDAFADALDALDAAVRDSRRRGSPFGLAHASACRGFVHGRQGNLRDAVTDLEAALALRELGWDRFTGPALAALAGAHLGLGQLEQALALEEELREVAGQGDLAGAVAMAAAGAVRAGAGDHQRALEDYRAAVATMGPALRDTAIIEWRELTARSLLSLGRRAEARALAAEAVSVARRWGAPRSLGSALRALSRLVPAHKAVPLLRESVYLLESCAAVDHLARARIDLGSVLLRSSAGRVEGVALLQQALEYARRTEVPRLARQATRVLTEHGVAVTVPADSPLHLLTPGERRVVELAVAGHTNRKIAQSLFVTVKAVEWHLSNAYRKLSIGSRAELPAALSGQLPAGDEDASSSAR